MAEFIGKSPDKADAPLTEEQLADDRQSLEREMNTMGGGITPLRTTQEREYRLLKRDLGNYTVETIEGAPTQFGIKRQNGRVVELLENQGEGANFSVRILDILGVSPRAQLIEDLSWHDSTNIYNNPDGQLD